jgi:hypothetical protein
MAGISIPIVTEFDGGGINKAIKQFQQLETNGEKAQFAIRKAAVPAAAAIGALTVALGDAVKAAIDDTAAQEKLAGQLARTTGATDAQIKANEDWISTQGKLLGYTDDQLRPALSKLATQTHDLTKAQEGVALAMDIATATGKPLETVTSALEKAYGGNEKALAKLSPELKDMIKSGMSLDEVMGVLSETFGGAASEAANTTAGKFKLMKISIDETKESIGASLMPVVEAVLPYLQSMAKWAQDNPGVFTIIAGTIGAIAVSILAVNTAMALNPFGLIAVGIGLLVTGIGIAYTKFEGFRSLVRTVVNGLSDYFEFMANSWIKATNVLITAMNLISPFKDIPKIGAVSFGKIGAEPTAGGGFTSTAQAEAALFGGKGGSGGGGVSAAAPTPIASAGAGGSNSGGFGRFGGFTATRDYYMDAPIIDNIDGNAGGFANAGIGGIGPFANLTINVDGGDPNAVVQALQDYVRANGPVPVNTRAM